MNISNFEPLFECWAIIWILSHYLNFEPLLELFEFWAIWYIRGGIPQILIPPLTNECFKHFCNSWPYSSLSFKTPIPFGEDEYKTDQSWTQHLYQSKKGFEIWPKRLIIFCCEEPDQQMWGVIQESSRRRLEATLVSFLITPCNFDTNTIQYNTNTKHIQHK